MENVTVRLTGTTPLIMHSDDVQWADAITAWLSVSENKKGSVAGDDRHPAWKWVGSVYRDEDADVVAVTSDMIRSMMMGAGAKMPKTAGRGTMKTSAICDILIDAMYFPLRVGGKTIAWSKIDAMRSLKKFQEHTDAVKALGFSLQVKRATVGSSKHIRVRPIFSNWSIDVPLVISGESWPTARVEELFRLAGSYVGIGDWRPGAPKKPGVYGKFTAEIV